MTGPLVAVLGQVADGEVHAVTGRAAGCGGVAKVPLRRCRHRPARARAGRPRACPPSAAVDLGRAGAEVEVGHQPRQPQDGGRAAVGRVGGGQRGVQRLDRERDRVRVVALEEQEARDRAGVGRRGHGAPVGLEAADGLQQRQRLAVAQVRLGVLAVRRAARRAASAGPCRPTRSPRPPAGTRAPRRAASCGRSRPRTARSARARTRRPSTGRSARAARDVALQQAEVERVDRLPHLAARRRRGRCARPRGRA